MSTHTHPVVRAYLARVRTALSDLPEAEIDEIVDDVRPHLAEIADGIGDHVTVDAMIEHLGTPEGYAAEVRAAGEYPPAPPSGNVEDRVSRRRPGARFALWGLVLGAVGAAVVGAGLAAGSGEHALLFLLLVVPLVGLAAVSAARAGLDAVRALPEARWLADARSGRLRELVRTLNLLHPVWWALAAAFLLLVGVLTVLRTNSGVLVLLTLGFLGALGVWAGPRARRDRRMVWVALPVSAFVAGAALGIGGYLIDSARAGHLDEPTAPYAHEHLYTAGDGSPLLFYGTDQVENLYVFDAEGKPLTEFYLYDQNGAPVLLPRHGCDPNTGERIQVGEDNRFPRPRIEQGGVDDFGTVNGYNAYRPFCEKVDGVPFTVAVPSEVK